MTVFFTSDLHIGHAKVAEHRGFASVEEHDAALAAAWDEAVPADGNVWVLGDLSAGGNKAQENALAWIAARPGTKDLVLGNHDGPHPMYRDAHKHFAAYVAVFRSIASAARRRIEGTEVLLSHFPYTRDRKETRHLQWRLRDEGAWLLHGHTHGNERLSVNGATKEIHVGLDAWDLKPVPLASVASLMQAEDDRREANRLLREAFLTRGSQPDEEVPCTCLGLSHHNTCPNWSLPS